MSGQLAGGAIPDGSPAASQESKLLSDESIVSGSLSYVIVVAKFDFSSCQRNSSFIGDEVRDASFDTVESWLSTDE